MLLWVLNLSPRSAFAQIAPVPLLLAAFSSATHNEARLLSLIAAILGLSGNFGYYTESAGGPWIAVGLILLQSLAWAFVIPSTAKIVNGSKHWASVFVYPVFWAAVDTLIGNFSPHGSFGSLAYSQSDQLSSLQLAALAGTPGIVFVTSLFASILSVAIHRAKNIEKPKLAYGLPIAILAAAFLYGTVQVQAPRSTANRIQVGLASIDDFIGPKTPAGLKGAVWLSYESLIEKLASQGARIVLLPEKIEVEQDDVKGRLEWLAHVAYKNRVYLGAGLGVPENQRLRNRFWIFDPKGKIVLTYDKQRPVPGVEWEFEAGTEFQTLDIDGVRVGVAICKDMHFAAVGRGYGKRGVDAVLVPAWDYDDDASLTAHMTSLRGIEGGYAIVRSSRQGMLTVSDRFGRVSSEVRSGALPGVSLLAEVPILRPGGETFYSRYGDVFGFLCVALALYLRFRS